MILLTGGSGRLGRALRELMPQIVAPTRSELDITNLTSIQKALAQHQPSLVVHAAAYTNVAKAEQERALCWRVNVEGTRNLGMALQGSGIPLLHISTDYVFWGDVGNYLEDDPPGPVRNYYALTKLVAEEAVRQLPRHLIVRTSFRERPWPYPTAYEDLYTGQDYLDKIAPELALATEHFEEIPFDTLHIVTERKSAYELARQSRPDVRPSKRSEAPVALPEDISLGTRRWQELKAKWKT